MSAPHANVAPEVLRQLVLGGFVDPRQARRVADILRGSGFDAEVSTPPSEEAFEAAGEGIATVRFGRLAWVGLGVGVLLGLAIGIALWRGQIVVLPLAPALPAGRTAVAVLMAGTLGAFGWLAGALLTLALSSPSSEVVVRLPAGSDQVTRVEQELVRLGAWNVRATPTSR